MLWRELLAELLTSASNAILKLDPQQQKAFAPLTGKTLQLQLTPLPVPVILAFSNAHIDISIPHQPVPHDAVDCSLVVALSALDKVRDTSQLTALIKADKLDLQGDLQVLQQLNHALSQLSLSWEGFLSRLLGERAAQAILSFHEQQMASVKLHSDNLQVILAEALIEEKRLIAPAIFVADFCDDVTAVRVATDRLQARLARLEQQATPPSPSASRD
jgi:ubiquinone biosynthesis protein UbiJ